MNVMIVASKACSHRPNLEHELRQLGVEFKTVYVEEAPELVKRLGIRHSPNVVIDEEVVYRRQPTEQELRELFNGRQGAADA